MVENSLALSVVSKLKRFWLWLNREPKDLDKAIKTHEHEATGRFYAGLLGLVMAGLFALLFAPVLQQARVSNLYSDIEYLALVSGVCVVLLGSAFTGLLLWHLSLQSENRALHYRLRKLEKRFEAEKVD
jgi:hypothetical protein